jgi:hypothetical protein
LNGQVSLTKVALSRPAKVCPKRSDRSSVAKARSYTSVSDSHVPKNGMMMHTLARGTMARNETIDGLEGVWGIVAYCLTNKDQGITELDKVEYPLQGWLVARPRGIIVKGHVRKVV